MILVQLPADILGGGVQQITYDHAELVQNKLFHGYQIEVCVHACSYIIFMHSVHVYCIPTGAN